MKENSTQKARSMGKTARTHLETTDALACLCLAHIAGISASPYLPTAGQYDHTPSRIQIHHHRQLELPILIEMSIEENHKSPISRDHLPMTPRLPKCMYK